MRLRAAREEPGEATVTVEVLGTGGRAVLRVPSTGDRYAWTTVAADLPGTPGGVRDLRLTLHGPVRVERLAFT